MMTTAVSIVKIPVLTFLYEVVFGSDQCVYRVIAGATVLWHYMDTVYIAYCSVYFCMIDIDNKFYSMLILVFGGVIIFSTYVEKRRRVYGKTMQTAADM